MGPFKISTLVAILAIFLVGEFAVVTYGPYPPNTRKYMVQSLPVVKQVREWQHRQDVRMAFEEQDGAFSWTHKDSTYTWTSADILIQEAREGSRVASNAMDRLIANARLRRDYPEFQRKARQGDLFAMGDYYFFARQLNEHQDSTEAATMLSNHPSASARWTLAVRSPGFDWTSRENQLLLAEVQRENLRHPGMKDADYARISAGNRDYLDGIRRKAEEDDTDAQWVIEQLATRPVWHPAGQ